MQPSQNVEKIWLDNVFEVIAMSIYQLSFKTCFPNPFSSQNTLLLSTKMHVSSFTQVFVQPLTLNCTKPPQNNRRICQIENVLTQNRHPNLYKNASATFVNHQNSHSRNTHLRRLQSNRMLQSHSIETKALSILENVLEFLNVQRESISVHVYIYIYNH